jgi:hypothetical protein
MSEKEIRNELFKRFAALVTEHLNNIETIKPTGESHRLYLDGAKQQLLSIWYQSMRRVFDEPVATRIEN